MPAPSYAITGVPIKAGQSLPLRYEITAWANSEDNRYQVSLFLRALAELKAKPVEEQLGYFQLAGPSLGNSQEIRD